MIFTKESAFEKVLIEILSHKGWEKEYEEEKSGGSYARPIQNQNRAHT